VSYVRRADKVPAITAGDSPASRNRTERILAIVAPQHQSSQRVLTKLGMHPIGSDHLLDRTWFMYELRREVREKL
jgi:RimJ/RimL family protein N-acetyltransferase